MFAVVWYPEIGAVVGMKLPRPGDAEQLCARSAKRISPDKDREANG